MRPRRSSTGGAADGICRDNRRDYGVRHSRYRDRIVLDAAEPQALGVPAPRLGALERRLAAARLLHDAVARLLLVGPADEDRHVAGVCTASPGLRFFLETRVARERMVLEVYDFLSFQAIETKPEQSRR